MITEQLIKSTGRHSYTVTVWEYEITEQGRAELSAWKEGTR